MWNELPPILCYTLWKNKYVNQIQSQKENGRLETSLGWKSLSKGKRWHHWKKEGFLFCGSKRSLVRGGHLLFSVLLLFFNWMNNFCSLNPKMKIIANILTVVFIVQVNSCARSQDLTFSLVKLFLVKVVLFPMGNSRGNSRKFKLYQKIRGRQKPSIILSSFPELPKYLNLKYF